MTSNSQRPLLPLSSKWLPPFLSPPEMTSDEERQAEGIISVDRIITEVHSSIRAHYHSLQPLPHPPQPLHSSLPDTEKYNHLVGLREKRSAEYHKLTETLAELRTEADRLAALHPESQLGSLTTQLSTLHTQLTILKHDHWTCEAIQARCQANNTVRAARTSQLKSAYSFLSAQLQTALNVVQIDENWTLSFTQQRAMIENDVAAMRAKRVDALAEMLDLAGKTRTEVNDGKAGLIRERVRRIKGEDRREKLRGQIEYARLMGGKAKEMKENTRKQLKMYQERSDRFENTFKTRDPAEISKKFRDMMTGNDILQKNIEEMLINEAKLKHEYTKMRIDLSKLILSHRRSVLSPQPLLKAASFPAQQSPPVDPPATDQLDLVYHWLNNLCGLLLRVSRMDTYSLLGPSVPIVLLYSTEAARMKSFDYGKQTAKVCALLEKKLVTAVEIVQQRGKMKGRKRKTTYTQAAQGLGAEERLRMKIIAEQHFIQNPPASIQSLIGSYASALQKEISSKPTFDTKFARTGPKLVDRAQSEIEQRETEFLLSGQQTAKARKPILPFLDVGDKQKVGDVRTERGMTFTPKPGYPKDVAGELRDYVTSRTQQLRKSASTEGLVDFLRDLQLRKRDLAHFIDQHKSHIRAFSQNLELERTLKKTVSSMASTSTSARRMVKSSKISPVKRPG